MAPSFLLPALLTVGLMAPLFTHASMAAEKGRFSADQVVSVGVYDPDTGQPLDRLGPGRVLTIEAGQRVVLRLETVTSNERRFPRPRGEFLLLSGESRVRLTRGSRGGTETLLEGVRTDHPDDPDALTLIGYETDDARGNPLTGAIAVTVKQPPPIPVYKLEMEVWDPYRRESIGTFPPGANLEIESGQRVQIRMIAVDRDGRTRRVLPVDYRMVSGFDQLNLNLADSSEGWIDLEGRDSSRAGQARIGYTLGGNLDLRRGTRRQGEFTVSVRDPYQAIGQPTSARDMVFLLYRAILLREPEEAIIEARAQRIRERGLEGLQQQAREIASSPESLAKFRGDGNVDDRLEPLYLHLLGVEAQDIPAAERQAFTQLLRRKEVQRVVESLIGSERFLFRHGLYEQANEDGDVQRPRLRRRP